MYLKKVQLINFRNYSEQIIEFNNNINYFFGNNAQGKTNILESIYLASIGKSHRMVKDSQLIAFNKSSYSIDIVFNKNNRDFRIQIISDVQKGKMLKLNGTALKKISDLPGILLTVMFCPDDIKITKEDPSYRRRFLDVLICQLHKSHLYHLQQYDKIMMQRNSLLKQIREKSSLEKTLDVWDEKLEEVGTKIIQKRIYYLEILKKISVDIHSKISTGECLGVKYKCSFVRNIDNTLPVEQIKQRFKEQLEQNRKADIKKGFTSIGPQRDDIEFLINDLSVEKFSSQGQQRTVILSLKLAELEILKEVTQEVPILLLDDVFSELDQERIQILLKYISNMQVLITSTDLYEYIKDIEVKRFLVANGKVEEV